MAYVTYNAKRDLITTNLALYSEQFDNAYWTKTNVTVTADNTTAPDGEATMDRIVETAVTAVHEVNRSFTLTDSATYVWTVYAKQNQRTWIELFVTKKDGTTGSAYFDLATGAAGTTTGVTAAIVASDNGSYRCSVSTSVLTGATTPICGYRLATGDGVNSYLGDIANGVYAWGAHLQLTSAPEYNPTTSAAGHASGSSYAIGFDAEQLDRSSKTQKTRKTSIGGSIETTYQRSEVTWAVKTTLLEETDLKFWREFLGSVAGGESFTFDPYGSSSVGDDGLRDTVADTSLTCIIDSDSTSEDREGTSRYYRIGFNVRVL